MISSMNSVQVRFSWIDQEKSRDLGIPAYHSDLASGMDVAAAIEGELTINPGEIVLIPSGFCVAIPAGYEIQIRPRSGLAIKHGITVVNAPGTIDADYRGEVRIGLINLGDKSFSIHRGDRIAQMVLAPVFRAFLEVADELDDTVRGRGGFGHTGR
jgi:dUTP pyrophosphatase